MSIPAADALMSIFGLVRVEGEMKWKHIESAPKDGTNIIVYTEYGMNVVYWDRWWQVDDNKHGPFDLRGPAPTHWMPLPEPPEE